MNIRDPLSLISKTPAQLEINRMKSRIAIIFLKKVHKDGLSTKEAIEKYNIEGQEDFAEDNVLNVFAPSLEKWIEIAIDAGLKVEASQLTGKGTGLVQASLAVNIQ